MTHPNTCVCEECLWNIAVDSMRRTFQRDTGISPPAGTIVAEFVCPKDARNFAKQYGYSVTAGINYPYAVRVPVLESADDVRHVAATAAAPTPSTSAQGPRGFTLLAFTPKGKAAVPTIQRALDSLFDADELGY